MAQGIVAEMSPFQGHKLPRERKTQQTQRRAFTNDECLKLIDAAKDIEDTRIILISQKYIIKSVI
jgi:hypothetical protein